MICTVTTVGLGCVINMTVKQFAKRTGIPEDELWYMSVDEMNEMLADFGMILALLPKPPRLRIRLWPSI
jgi:hypothetical protein